MDSRAQQVLVLLVGEPECHRGDVLFQVRDRRGIGDRQHRRRPVQQPGEGYLCRGGVMLRRDGLQDPSRTGQLAAADGEPRDERQALPLAVLQRRLGTAAGQAVEVLYADDRGGLACLLDLGHGDLGQADVADLAFTLQRDQLRERFAAGTFGSMRCSW